MFKKKEISFGGKTYKLYRLTAGLQPIECLPDIEEHLITHNAEVIDIRIRKSANAFRCWDCVVLFYATKEDIYNISYITKSGFDFNVRLV